MDTLFFILSKIGWALVSPDSLIVILCIATWVAALKGRTAASRKFAASVVFFLITLSFLPVGEWLISPLENSFPANAALPADAKGIIVLGGAISPLLSQDWQQTQLNGAADRLTHFYYLASLYPNAQLVFSGGSGALDPQSPKEADSAFDFFNLLKLNDRAILYESDSRNTVENVNNTKLLLNPQAQENWIVVTSAFHMPRSVGIFCQQDWPVTAYPVDHRSHKKLLRLNFDLAGNLAVLKRATKEWLGLVVYRIAGHTSHFLPRAEDSCKKF